MKENAVTSDNQ